MARQSHEPAAADNAPGRRVADSDRPWGEQHLDVVRSEIAAINTRREQTRQIGEPEACEVIDVVGLAQSGGGIRSSAFCLGVLQALNHHGLIERIDYLSTVSGGGYIGSSLSATMTVTG
jgi:predicted acylesterase/phospholipase RssA